MAEWRYLLTEINPVTGVHSLLLPDVRLIDVQLNLVLSGHSQFSGTMPRQPGLTNSDGTPIFKRWGNGIAVERDGQLISYYIITDYTKTRDNISIQALSVSGYLDGQPYRSYHAANADDCAALYRHLWKHHQSYPGSNLGVTCEPYTSRQRIGFIPRVTDRKKVEAAQAKYDAARKAEERTEALFNKSPKNKTLATTLLGLRKATAAHKKTLDSLEAAYDKQSKLDEAYNQKMADTGWFEYKLAWYDGVDLGSKATELAQTGRFDWTCNYAWVGDTITCRMTLFHDDLHKENLGRFVVGENVVEAPELSYPNELFATDVWVNGAGEGTATAYAVSTHDYTYDGLTRWKQLQERTQKNKVVLQAKANAEAKKARAAVRVGNIVCKNHPNAPFGTVSLGDYIFLQGNGIGYNGTIDLWVRVINIAYEVTTDRVTYTVAAE